MLVELPDGTARQLQDRWLDKVASAERAYTANRTEKTRLEYMRVLKIFADLVVRAKLPSD